MAQYADEREAIEGRIQTLWGARTPVKWENVRFDETTQGRDGRWMEVVIVQADAEQISLNTTPCRRYTGEIHMILRAPEEAGSEDLLQDVDFALGMFMTTTGQPVEFSASSSGRIQTRIGRAVKDGLVPPGHFQVRAVVPFIRDRQS